MRRTLLISVLLSLALGTIGSAAPQPTEAASSRVIITLPVRVTRDRLTSARISLPGSVAALDGRVLVSSRAAEVIGVAVSRKGVSLMPVAIKGGFAYGAYNLRPYNGRTVVDVVLLPHTSGRIGIRITVDSMADGSLPGPRPARRPPAPWVSPMPPARRAPARAPGCTPRANALSGTASRP